MDAFDTYNYLYLLITSYNYIKQGFINQRSHQWEVPHCRYDHVRCSAPGCAKTWVIPLDKAGVFFTWLAGFGRICLLTNLKRNEPEMGMGHAT